jgi:alkyl sulfatase BDS1-like metallo-beta-lactamase superfamily hydrolase
LQDTDDFTHNEMYSVTVRNGVLTYRRSSMQDPKAKMALTPTKATLDAISLGQTTFDLAVAGGGISSSGD